MNPRQQQIKNLHELDNLNEMEKRNFLMESAISYIKNSFSDIEGRMWLECFPPNSHNNETYKVKLFRLSGSPPKGYILADYSWGKVIAISKVDFKITKRLDVYIDYALNIFGESMSGLRGQ